MENFMHADSHGQFNLYHCAEKFIIEPVVGEGCLEIDRYTPGEPKLRLSNSPVQSSQAIKIERINGIVGIIELISGPYLIIIKSATNVGTLNEAEIFQISDTDLIPFNTDLHLSEREKKINQSLLEMLQTVLSTDGFYYSPRLDLSHTFQWLSENSTPEIHQQPLLSRVDSRFMWNTSLCRGFNTPEFSKFVNPLIHGFVGIRQCFINQIPFKLAIISRRSVLRAGVRFHTRGADSEGNCANFIETEQIVEYEVQPSQGQPKSRHISSFVQMRGSIPLLWSQKPNLKWQPEPDLRNLDEQFNCVEKHLNSLFQQYGREALSGLPRKIVILNLINQYGREHAIGTQLSEVIRKIRAPAVKYVAFDFHRHCQSLNWDRLSLLREEVEPDIRQFGFFSTKLFHHNDSWVEISAENRLYQNGFFRTNCMDCLDRTNVVQALLGMESIRFQLQYFGIIGDSVRNFDNWPNFVHLFKNLWADNGDNCSRQYGGTPALKSDYTRLGQRTFVGALRDLNNAVTRYFKNNFTDGFRQDAINLLLGNYTVDKATLPENVDHSLINFDANGAAIAGAIFSAAMTILCILVSENISATLFWFVIFAAFTAFIWVNGDDFVDQPQLMPTATNQNSKEQKSQKLI